MKLLISAILLTFSITACSAKDSVELVKGSGKTAVVKTGKAKAENVVRAYGIAIAEVTKTLKQLKLKVAGPAFFKLLERDDGIVTFQSGYEITKKVKNVVGLDVITMPKGNMVQVLHKGSFADTKDSYNKIISWLNKNNQEAAPGVYEFYLSDPTKVSPPNQEMLIQIPLQ
tara:strand:- start:165 stop:677 length:513 start_codon:yes stop_codon:yes gene_type:complete